MKDTTTATTNDIIEPYSVLTNSSTNLDNNNLSEDNSNNSDDNSDDKTSSLSLERIELIEEEISKHISGRYEHNLKKTESKAVDEFLKLQNWSSSDAKNWNIAVKFLMARKFDVERAIKLYNDHENLRKKEGLDFINLNDLDFIKELESGKFTILPFVKNYPICALFTVRLHNGCSNSAYELVTLKTLIYQLDAALENPDAQRNGINFIYDMNNCKRSNYDLSLSQKILTLVRGSYPARLNKLYVVSAPFWFKCIVKVLSILMREKLRERVLFVSNEELKNQIPVEILPDYLGGLVKLNHSSWLIECNKLVTNKASTCSYYYYTKQNGETNQNNSKMQELNSKDSFYDLTKQTKIEDEIINTNRKRQSSDFIDIDDKKSAKKQLSSTNSVQLDKALSDKIEPLPFNNHYESIQNVDPKNMNGLSITELVEHVINAGSYGLSEEFKLIRNQPILSSFDTFKSRENAFKNRYRDVICLDESRIHLNSIEALNKTGDYIHANYVDGYKQKNAYISTQGPLEETVEDFWRMVWQETILVIAMTTKVVEQRKLKCAQYWPLEQDEILKLENLFEIKNHLVEDLEDYRVSQLSIKNLLTNQTRNIVHCQFLSWPDHGVPKSASQILDFINLVRKSQNECLKQPDLKWSGHPLGPPICVHCSAGIGRTGTFCAIDISVNRLNDCKTVNILDTVNKIRSQRTQSVQMRDQYVFCYLAVLEYAQKEKLLDDVDLAQLFDSLF